VGGVSGEAMAMLVHQQLYDGKPVSELTQAEKENIRAVATLASGLVGGVAGDGFENAATAASAGYNAAVNNVLDTFWDAGNLIWDGGKFVYAFIKNDEELKKESAIDFAADSVALAIPFAPAGSTKAIRAASKKADIGAITKMSSDAKIMRETQIADLLGDVNWHQKSFKSDIAKKYSKELKGSKNFDFYIDKKTGAVFIKGNQHPNTVIRIK
jgi:filamentous hemagglutinin